MKRPADFDGLTSYTQLHTSPMARLRLSMRFSYAFLRKLFGGIASALRFEDAFLATGRVVASSSASAAELSLSSVPPRCSSCAACESL